MARVTRAAVFFAPLLASMAGSQADPILVEVWYGPMCSHCMFFLSQMLPALFHAQLPGDQVQLTLLPYVQQSDGSLPAVDQCSSDAAAPCHFLPAPLCALQAVPQPSPIDSPAMDHAYQFMLCDLAHANSGSPVPQTPETIQSCADNAQISTPEWKDCVATSKRTPEYEAKSHEIWDRLQKLDSMMAPFVFINGDVVECEDPQTCHTRSAPDVKGTITQIVCNKIPAPLPAGCITPLRKFEDMLTGDVSAIHPQASRLSAPAALAAGFAVVGAVLLGLAVAARRRASPSGREPLTSEQGYESNEESFTGVRP